VILLVILLFSVNTKEELLPSTYLTLQEIQLVNCLTYISHRYFTAGRSLVISATATYRDVQMELIAEIHRTSTWPVVVTVDGIISKTDETEFIDKDGSYIILIPDGNIESFKVQFNGLAEGRNNKSTRFWNSEARFVVAGANEFSMSQQTDIFEYFSKFRIYNCIIVSHGHYVIDNVYSRPIIHNDVDRSVQLGVFSWFPYQSSDRCTEVNDITLLDIWVPSAQGHFTKNTDLFATKISNSFNGCTMKTVVRQSYWTLNAGYVNEKLSNGSIVWKAEGPDVDLLMAVLQKLNMTFVSVPTPQGFGMKIGLVQNLISAMIAKEVYIALGDVGNHILLESYFDSTSTYNTFSVRWYIPCPVKYPRWSSFFRILSVELWIFLIISIVIASISTTLLGRYSCTLEWQGYKTLTNSLINVLAVILGVSVSTMPRTPSLRLLFLAWVCFSLAFSTVFQAFLTTSGSSSGIIMAFIYKILNIAFVIEDNFCFADQMAILPLTLFSMTKRTFICCNKFLLCFWNYYNFELS
jgi:hypothetical protein